MVKSEMRLGGMLFALSVLSAVCLCVGAFVCVRTDLQWDGIFIGVASMVLAILFHIVAHKRRVALYVLSVIANSVGSGLSVGAYYSVTGKQVSVGTLLTVFSLFVLTSLVLCFFLSAWKHKIMPALIAGLALSALTAGSIFGWVTTQSNFYSLSFFFILLMIYYYAAYLMTFQTLHDLFRNASFGNFGAFLLITLAVLVVLSEGEFLEIADFFDGIGSGKASKRKK